jgi:glycosyltransferase involved in cell wall biosynthesis
MTSSFNLHVQATSKPFISLALASVGRTEQVERLFDSLLAQTSTAFEVILADQNGDDRLVPAVKRAVGLGMSVVHLRLEKPDQYAARSIGIEKAQGLYIAFPDDDCWYEPEVIERAISIFETKNADGLVAYWRESREALEYEADSDGKELEWVDVCGFRSGGASMITQFYKTAVVRAIGGFDKRMGLGCWFGGGEDTDMFFTIVRKGFRVVMASEVVVRHHFSLTPAHNINLTNLRLRSRGTGALYAKHNVPFWVIFRGVVSPLVRPILTLNFERNNLALAYMQTIGRLEGFLNWIRNERD